MLLIPPVKLLKYGTNSVALRGSLVWVNILTFFEENMHSAGNMDCRCLICIKQVVLTSCF